MTGATSIMNTLRGAGGTLEMLHSDGGDRATSTNFFTRRLLRCNSLTSFSGHSHNSSGDESTSNNNRITRPRRSRRNSLSRSSSHEKKDEDCEAESMRLDALNGLQMPTVTATATATKTTTTFSTRPVYNRTQSCGDVAPKAPLSQRTSSCSSISCKPEVQSMAEEAFKRQALPTERTSTSNPMQAMEQSLHGGSVSNNTRTPGNARLTQSVHEHGQGPTSLSSSSSSTASSSISPRNISTTTPISQNNTSHGTNFRRRVRLGGHDRPTSISTPSTVSHNTSLQTNMRQISRPERLSAAPTRPLHVLSQSLHSSVQDKPRNKLDISSRTDEESSFHCRLPSRTVRDTMAPLQQHSSHAIAATPTTTTDPNKRMPSPSSSSCYSNQYQPLFRGASPSSNPATKPALDDATTPLLIEIFPGVTARLRGAKETYQAVENDFYRPAQCQVCQADVCCIMDASYLLCPKCRSVSPLESATGCSILGRTTVCGGIGMGFTMDELCTWQTQILASQSFKDGGCGNDDYMACVTPRRASIH